MPTRAKRFCNWPGCCRLASGRYCEEHQLQYEQRQAEADQKYNQDRGSAAERGYNSDWQAARLMHLRRYPLCERCLERGFVVPAVLVHHDKPLSDGGARLDPGNMVSLCQPCHEEIHGSDRWRPRTQRGSDEQADDHKI